MNRRRAKSRVSVLKGRKKIKIFKYIVKRFMLQSGYFPNKLVIGMEKKTARQRKTEAIMNLKKIT